MHYSIQRYKNQSEMNYHHGEIRKGLNQFYSAQKLTLYLILHMLEEFCKYLLTVLHQIKPIIVNNNNPSNLGCHAC